MGSKAESGRNFAKKLALPAVFIAGVGGTVVCGGLLSTEVQRFRDLNQESHSAEMHSASMERVVQLNNEVQGSFGAAWYLFLGTVGSVGAAGGSVILETINVYSAIKRKPSSSVS